MLFSCLVNTLAVKSRLFVGPLDELMTVYRVQFPVMRQYERDTWYDATGRITFTASKGLVGAGLPRKAGRNDATCTLRFPDGKTRANRLGWEDVQPKDGKSQVPDGTAIERPIIEDTLPAARSAERFNTSRRSAWPTVRKTTALPGRTSPAGVTNRAALPTI